MYEVCILRVAHAYIRYLDDVTHWMCRWQDLDLSEVGGDVPL